LVTLRLRVAKLTAVPAALNADAPTFVTDNVTPLSRPAPALALLPVLLPAWLAGSGRVASRC
jgi:hypothetical protein